MRKLGKVKISKDFIINKPEQMLQFINTLGFLPLEYESIDENTYEVLGYSEHFEESFVIPNYDVILGQKNNELTRKTEFFIVSIKKNDSSK